MQSRNRSIRSITLGALIAPALAGSTFAQGGDTAAEATEIAALPFLDSGTTTGFNDDVDEVCPFADSTSPDVFYKYTPIEDEFIDIGLCESSYDTKVYVYDDTMTSIACNDDACSDALGNPYRSSLELVELQAGITYLVVIDGWGGESGDYLLQIERSEVQCISDPPFLGTESALSFDGTNDVVNVPDAADLQFSAGEPITLEAWVRPFSLDGLRNILSKSSDPTANYGFRLEGDRSIALYYRNASDTGWFEFSTPGAVVEVGGWSHVAVTHTFGAEDIAVYVNGIDVGGTWGAIPSEGPLVTTQDLLVGATVTGAGVPERYLDGYLDELRIWRAVRTQAEIAAAMNTTLSGGEAGLVAYWQFEEGSGGTAGDAAGDHDGALDGPAWQMLAECAGPCAGDATGDGAVDVQDLLVVLGGWGSAGAGDVTGDGTVDVQDLLLVLGAWGPCPAPLSACCIDDGCVEMTGDECVALGGIYNPGDACGDGVCNSSDGWIVDAPFIWPGDTCGDADDCLLSDSPDGRWVVTIPSAGDWTFSVCGASWDTILWIGSVVCSDDVGFNDDADCGAASEVTLPLEPGTYFVTLEGFVSVDCGAYTLVVLEE